MNSQLAHPILHRSESKFVPFTISTMFFKRRDAKDRKTAALSSVATAIATFVLLVSLSAVQSSWNRSVTPSWQNPTLATGTEVGSHPNQQVSVTSTTVREKPVLVTYISSDESTVPPSGLTSLPGKTEVYASPAIISLAKKLPAAEFAGRIGTSPDLWVPLPKSTLSTPDELSLLIGVTADDPRLTPALVPVANNPSIEATAGEYTGFGSSGVAYDELSPALVAAAFALLSVPIFTLLGGAARLGMSRREQAVSRLRLAGSGTKQTRTYVAVEAGGNALVGVLAAIVLYLASLPLLAQIKFQGERSFVHDLKLPALVILGLIAGILLISAIEANRGLRNAVANPWATSQQQRANSTKLRRLWWIALGAVSLAILARTTSLDLVWQLAMVVVAYSLFYSMGAFVVDIFGRSMSRTARGAVTLLAGRRMAQDPRSAWRQVSGLVMAGFIAGFFGGASLGTAPVDGSSEGAVLPVPLNLSEQALTQVNERISGSNLYAELVEPDELFIGGLPDILALVISGGSSASDIDRSITELSGIIPGQPVFSKGALDLEFYLAGVTLREVALATLVLSIVLAIAATGSAGAVNILNRAEVYRTLHLQGVPIRVVSRARVVEAMAPLTLLLTLSVGLGLLAASFLNSALGTTADTSAVVLVLVFSVVGLLGTWVSIKASGSTLTTVSTALDRQE